MQVLDSVRFRAVDNDDEEYNVTQEFTQDQIGRWWRWPEPEPASAAPAPALAPALQLNLVPVGGFNAVRLKLKGLDISPTGPVHAARRGSVLVGR